MTSTHDIIIVGGGMVGSALALALAQQTSLSIALLEAQPQDEQWSPAHYHHRVSAIALSSQRILQSLHVWDDIQQKRISPFTQIAVWDADGKNEIYFDSKEIAAPLLGFIVENNVMQSALQEKIKHYPQITFLSPIKLVKCIEQENAIELTAEDGTWLSAKLVIAADGAHSWIRQCAGIDIDKYDYSQEAIVAMVNTALPHQKIARQVFLETGPLAFLPLRDANTTSIVWSLPVGEAKRLMNVDIDEFKHLLTQAFDSRLGEVLSVGKRYSFPLYKQQARNYVKSRIALVGDAAHTVHPLAGQGVNIGFLDAASLVDVIVEAIEKRRDFASLATLRRYERWRRADNMTMLAGIDFIKKIFASDKKSVKNLRSLGLGATSRIQWVKNIFTRHAVGDRAGLPKMAAKAL